MQVASLQPTCTFQAVSQATTALAYYAKSKITQIKSFIFSGSWYGLVIKLLFSQDKSLNLSLRLWQNDSQLSDTHQSTALQNSVLKIISLIVRLHVLLLCVIRLCVIRICVIRLCHSGVSFGCVIRLCHSALCNSAVSFCCFVVLCHSTIVLNVMLTSVILLIAILPKCCGAINFVKVLSFKKHNRKNFLLLNFFFSHCFFLGGGGRKQIPGIIVSFRIGWDCH